MIHARWINVNSDLFFRKMCEMRPWRSGHERQTGFSSFSPAFNIYSLYHLLFRSFPISYTLSISIISFSVFVCGSTHPIHAFYFFTIPQYHPSFNFHIRLSAYLSTYHIHAVTLPHLRPHQATGTGHPPTSLKHNFVYLLLINFYFHLTGMALATPTSLKYNWSGSHLTMIIFVILII